MGAASPAQELAVETLFDASRHLEPARGADLPEPLKSLYGGDLAISLRPDRPAIVANFVSTIDGVVSFNTPEAPGGGEVSGFFEPDRFVMGLLRTLADVVLVGAGTVRAGPTDVWTADAVYPSASDDFAALRRSLGLSPQPTTAVVTASGSLDLEHPGLSNPDVPVLIVTTDRGAAALREPGVPANVEVRSAGQETVGAPELVTALAEYGAKLILCEGGPHLFGQLLAAGLVDELFLTLAPQVAGRSTSTPRLSLVEDTAFTLADAKWGALTSLRRAGDHLFLRYSIGAGQRP